MAAPQDADSMVLVSRAELEELRRIREELPVLVAKAKEVSIDEYKQQRFAILHEKRKADPKAHSQKVLQKYYTNKEEINQRRRDRYREKKALEAAAKEGAESPN